MTYESSLPFVSFLNSDIVVSPPEIDLCKVLRSFEFIDELRNEWEGVVVPNHVLVQIPVILHHPFSSILLQHEEYRGSLFGLGRANIPFGKLFVDELRDFLLFFHQKGNQLPLLGFERVFEIDSMVPRLSEWEPTGGFFREDVEIGVVAQGYEFFRSANGFLGYRSLNLGLMDEL